LPAGEQTGVSLRVLRKVGAVLKRELRPGDLELGLLELGANSLDLVRIAGILEEEIGARPRLQDFVRIQSLGGVIEHLQTEQGADATPDPSGIDWVVRDAGCELTEQLGLILDEDERNEFRSAWKGLRRNLNGSVGLRPPDDWEAHMVQAGVRRSYREFTPRVLPLESLGGCLAALQHLELDGKTKLRYGSAGGLYPVQCYVYIKPLRVKGIEPGMYYYNPRRHALDSVNPDARIQAEVFTLANQEIFRAAAFAIFLIGHLDAILPMYGELSRDLCLIEAGLMSQLLESVAPEAQLGLCQIGRCEFSEIRSCFNLAETDIYLHCLLGGGLHMTDAAGAVEADEGGFEELEL
jgi:SagB-type dehydrogenase family enzyme